MTTVWRPRGHIRVIALGLHWRAGRLLAAEVRDDAGRLKGVRPLGGGVDFGETAAAALQREFMEELGVEIAIAGAPVVIENIYRHEGAAGHEIAFLYPVSLPEGAFAAQERIQFREDDGTPGCAGWYDPAELDLPEGPALFPAGLKHLLRG
ncbi:NUDIX hydrolase [Paenirhodobacter sp.]|uniref:NUDIX hydrolase n=1 Tax=Paenirhodobacter sp. TaxID=1965326 RepID=UPI003B514CFE